MGAFNEIITAAIEIMTLPVLILLFAVLLYIYGSFCLLIWCLTPNQRLNTTGYRRRKIPDIKTSQSKPKKSTSVAVQLKDTIIEDMGTAQLQIFNSCESKSSTTFYNIESDSKQKMEYQREEENFITVLSKRERRSLQHKQSQKQKKDEEQQLKNQQEQKQQQLEEKQTQEKQHQSNQQRNHKLLQNQNEFPAINNMVVQPIKPIFAENNAWAKALQIQDKQKHNEKEKELEKQQKLKKQQQKKPEERQELEEKQQKNQEKRLQNNQKKQEKPSRSEKKQQQKNSEQDQKPENDDTIVEDYVMGNKKRCKNHNTIIKKLREENEVMRVQYESSRNNWTANEFKTVLEGVRAEVEIKRLDAIKVLLEKHQTNLDELKCEHEVEVEGLHLYYQTKLNDLQLDHGLAARAVHVNHEILVNELRNINYWQNQRHGTAMQNLRDVNEKIRKEHQNEVRSLREKYENTIKDQKIRIKNLIEEKELRCAQEKLVRELSEKNIDQHHITIEAQINNNHDDKDIDTRTATIADDDTVDTIDMLKSQNLTLNNTAVDYNQIFDDMEQKLIQLHGYTSSNDSDCSSHTENLLQQLNDVEVDALQLNASSPQKSYD